MIDTARSSRSREPATNPPALDKTDAENKGLIIWDNERLRFFTPLRSNQNDKCALRYFCTRVFVTKCNYAHPSYNLRHPMLDSNDAVRIAPWKDGNRFAYSITYDEGLIETAGFAWLIHREYGNNRIREKRRRPVSCKICDIFNINT